MPKEDTPKQSVASTPDVIQSAKPDDPEFWKRALWVARVDGTWVSEAIRVLRASEILKDESDAARKRFTETNDPGDWREKGSRDAFRASFMLFAQAIEFALKELLVQRNPDAPLAPDFNSHKLRTFADSLGLNLSERQCLVLGYCERALGDGRYPIPRIARRPDQPYTLPGLPLGLTEFDFGACEEIFGIILRSIEYERTRKASIK
jgi:hypothetical protein